MCVAPNAPTHCCALHSVAHAFIFLTASDHTSAAAADRLAAAGQRDGQHRHIGVGSDLLEQRPQILHEPDDRLGVEQVAVVLEVATQALVAQLQLEREVEAGEADVD